MGEFVLVCSISTLLNLSFLGQMNPLLGKALLRVVLFYAYGLLVAWIFTFIEEKEELAHHKMERMLSELKKEVHIKYNMTDKEFNSFVRRATAAMAAGNQKDWNFVNSCGFVFSAITTIGKTQRRKKNLIYQMSTTELKVEETNV